MGKRYQKLKSELDSNIPESDRSLEQATNDALKSPYYAVVSHLEQASSIISDFNLPSDFASIITRARNLGRGFDHERALLLARDLSLDIDHALVRTLEDIYKLSITYAHDLARARTKPLVDDIHSARNRAISLARDLDLGRVDPLAFNRARDLDIKLNRVFDHANDLKSAIDLDPDRIMDDAFDFELNNLIALIKFSTLSIKSINLLLPMLDNIKNQLRPFRLKLEDPQELALSLDYLRRQCIPYLDSFVIIKNTIDEIKGHVASPIEILAIRKGSVTVDITGGIRDTVELVMDLIVPYRRKTKKRQAELDVDAKAIEVKKKEVELKKAQATLETDTEQANVDVEKGQVEVALLRQQERELALKNKKQELELFELTLAMVDKIKDDLPDSERLYYATKLLDPTRLIATSPLELISAQPIVSADGSEGETEDEETE